MIHAEGLEGDVQHEDVSVGVDEQKGGVRWSRQSEKTAKRNVRPWQRVVPLVSELVEGKGQVGRNCQSKERERLGRSYF